MDNKNIYVEDRVKMPRKYLNEAIFFLIIGATPWIAWGFNFRPDWIYVLGPILTVFTVGLVSFQHITGYLLRKNTTLKMKIDTQTKELRVWMHKAPEAWKKDFGGMSNGLDLNNLSNISFKRVNNKPMIMLTDGDNFKHAVIPYRMFKNEKVREYLFGIIETNNRVGSEIKAKALKFMAAAEESEAYELTKSRYELEEEGRL